LGAIVGFLLAVVLIQLIAAIPSVELREAVGLPELNLVVALSTMSILALIGLLAGFFPARRAAKLHVIDCLRH
jgi:putative ABC transport system permease protein